MEKSGIERGIEIAFFVILILGILSGKGRNIDNVSVPEDPVAHAARQSELSSDVQTYGDSYNNPSTGYGFYSSDYRNYAQYTDPRIGYQFYLEDARENAPEYIW
ncbi:MAG: hypothetical protein RLY49_287 [Candidatus Parcubacteria bacterium]|jgi:hypothetical protein